MTFAETCPRLPNSSKWTVFLLYFVSRVSWTFPAEGLSRVIGSPKPITAAPGDDVILPCHLEPRVNAQWITLEWTRTDMKPGYVYFRRGGVELRDTKISSYADRAALFADELKRGNMSLSIRNVTLADKGTYRCFVPSLKSHVVVQLVVIEKQTWTTAAPLTTRDLQTPDPGVVTDANDVRRRPIIWILPAVSIALLLVTAATVFIVKRKRRRHEDVGNKQTDDAASGLIVAETQSKPFAA
ncbi:myelin-oligodendrocyte glycoprotein-like [Solea solea]|uniref:myelin-oligodendrocyte glycoprotein-like n=1 Tax=Solea solea TaxID=90069 RepID=UPI00272A4824|nr:myelin-oligodendrocyte glycoprotein-like [Solea solea]